MNDTVDLVTFTVLRRIPTPGGDVLHGMKNSDVGFAGFGEAYFSIVEHGAIKGWKRHRLMTLNFVVPVGRVAFQIHEEQTGHNSKYILSANQSETYGRLTIPPGLWVAFSGLDPEPNVILNLANMTHDPTEADQRPLEHFPWLF